MGKNVQSEEKIVTKRITNKQNIAPNFEKIEIGESSKSLQKT